MKGLSLKDHYKNQKFNNLHEFFWGFGTAFHTVYAVVHILKTGIANVIALHLLDVSIYSYAMLLQRHDRNVTNMKKW